MVRTINRSSSYGKTVEVGSRAVEKRYSTVAPIETDLLWS